MRVTLDTNVLVSAFISTRGHSAEILDLIATFDEITLVVSEAMLEEFSEVMNREEVQLRFGHTHSDISEFREAIRSVAEVVSVKSKFRVVKEDPDDDLVINTAVDGRADYLVSGDKHLTKLKRFRGMRIVSPKTFMTIVTRKFGDMILSKSDFS